MGRIQAPEPGKIQKYNGQEKRYNYYTKAADIFRTLKWMSVISVFVLVVATFVLYRHEMTLENLRYIMRYANFETGSDYRTLNQISFKAEQDTEFAYLKGDLAMISPSSFSVYEFTGQALVEDRISYLNPALLTNGRYALIYDVTGTELALYNSNGCLFEKDFSFGIKNAALRSDGIFAVVSSGDFVSSEVNVYAADYNTDYTVSSTDKEIIAAALPNGTSRMELLMLNAEEGDFMCYLRSYDLRSQQEKYSAEVKIPGEYPLRLVSEKDSVTVLTDKKIRFYDGNLSLVSEYNTGSGKMLSFYESGDYVAVTYEKSAAQEAPIRVFSKSGREMTVSGIDGDIISFASNGRDMYFLEKGRLHLRSVNEEAGTVESKSVPETELDFMYTDVFAKSGSEYILVSPEGAGKFE